jgi:hypothetical protein
MRIESRRNRSCTVFRAMPNDQRPASEQWTAVARQLGRPLPRLRPSRQLPYVRARAAPASKPG